MDFHDVVTGSADDGGLRGGESYAQQVADAKALAATSLDGALQNLLGFEKTARLSGNVAGTRELVTAMVELCHASGDWQVLNETIALLAKRRAQLKQAVIAMVQLASTYVDAQPDQKLKVQLIDTLRSVSEGKLFVEVERARLTKLLAEMHEAKGEVEEARKLMQDTQVETLGGMDKREKTTFILEQVRLCLDTGDFVRAQIMAKKISTKVFKDPDLEELKLRYYALIVRYERHGHNWMAIFRAFQAMWDSPGLQADEAQAHRGLKLQVLYLVLAPFDSEQSSAMHALYELKALREPSSLQMYRYPPPRSRSRGGADPCFRQSSYVTPQPPRCHGRKH
jgi:26S proteasome regulatory subunit N5